MKQKIEKLNSEHKLKPDPSVAFYHGEVAFHLENYDEAQENLAIYIREAGLRGCDRTELVRRLKDTAGLGDKEGPISENIIKRAIPIHCTRLTLYVAGFVRCQSGEVYFFTSDKICAG